MRFVMILMGGGDRPEQVEVVLSLKAALYGTVIATYTVANNIACTMVMILNNIGWCNGECGNLTRSQRFLK